MLKLEFTKQEVNEIKSKIYLSEIQERIFEYRLKEYSITKMAYGKKLNEEMAEKWVKEMLPVGLHWTMEETTNAMQSLGYNFDKIDFFVVANMMYNDYFDLVKDDETLTLKLAKDWLDDEDAKENKLYCYWKYIIK